jgi:YaiO family outer membrane protein
MTFQRALCLPLALTAAFAASAAEPVPTQAPRAKPPAAAPSRASASFDEQFDAARQLARDGKREEAVAAFTALLARSPNNSDVLLARGRLYAWMDRWDEAEADLTAATRASPRYADAWSALGDMYRWSDRPALAADAYAHWSALVPKDPAPHLARGRALRLAGDAGGARAEFDKARDLGAAPADVEKAMDTLRPTSLAPDAVAPAGYDWSASLNGSKTWVSAGGFSDYRDYSLSLRRHFDVGSLAVEALRIERFGKDDTAYALDGYFDLWSRAYANARYQIAPDHTLFPETSGRIELYQGVGRGWELAASEDWLHFSSTKVNIYGIAVAKYLGNYYGRLRTTYVDTSGSVGWRLTLRDYYRGDADHYWEIHGGTSRGDNTTRGVTSLQWSQSAGIAWVTFFTPRWGFKVGADYSASDHTENSVSATLYSRW